MTKTEYKTQASQQRKASNLNAVAKSIDRNARKMFAPMKASLSKLARQIRREVNAEIAAQENLLMSL